MENALVFLNDLRSRVFNRPQISSDAFSPYPEAIACAFGIDVDYAQIVKPSKEGFTFPPPWQRRSRVKEGVKKHVIWGEPVQSDISTSLVERSNLTARQHSRRLARMTNGFSKKKRNHRASISLFAAHYNLCRVHETIRMTPGLALGVTDHAWTIEELIQAAAQPEGVPAKLAPFTLIQGGLS